jgi:pyruvate/2-oxoglutarate dehydrogenase complex dihydrolipoamide dehydrogenase (E3) component
MLVIGSGPIGCELGQGFARLGTNVTIFEQGTQFLPKEDHDCAVYLQEQMKEDGVNFMFETAT